MMPTLNTIRRRGLAAALLAGLGLASPATAGEPLIDPAALDSASAWSTPLWRGVVGPTDPQVRATFEDEVARLHAEDALEGGGEGDVLEDADEGHGEHAHAAAEAAEIVVPGWPHSVSIGTPNRGWLAHGIPLTAGEHFTVRQGLNYGAREAVEAIERAGAAVAAAHPGSPRLHVGDLSSKHGGRLKRHLSHQSGRDADIAYYLKSDHDEDNLKAANPRTLDVARTWTFIAALVADGQVEYVFSDRRLIPLLKRHAVEVARLPAEQVETLFGSSTQGGVIRHLRGHHDHIHVRFKAPSSIAAVREYVKRHGIAAIKPLPVYAKVQRGDSLWKLARRHRTTIKKLTGWNKLSRKSTLRPGQKLVIGWQRPSLPEVDGDT
ncbi:MAG: penicillin-insensitive murein endopeptidase [Myxococcales bacterium]|nr:penicillin-insensitive murein endopeptidase [Myxococcales bacterium]